MKEPLIASIALFLWGLGSMHAQVPQIINYQGRVAVGEVNFEGEGRFKFALVNTAGDKTYWSNDGTSTAGDEPKEAVALAVSKGLYSVLLGDATLKNMTAIPNRVFDNADVRLRVWFSDGDPPTGHGFQLLTPDQRIAAVGYAVIAANVQDGAITSAKIAAGAVGSAQLGNGAVQTSKIASGAVTAAQIAPGAVVSSLANEGLGAVPSEQAVVVSTLAADGALLQRGYLRLGAGIPLNAESWSAVPVPGAENSPVPQPVYGAWTGTEFLVFNEQGKGARYNPGSNAWQGIPAPTDWLVPRWNATTTWTGAEMIIWGGNHAIGNVTEHTNTGLRFNPATGAWRATRADSTAPGPRSGAGGVWTGTRFVVWGGEDSSISGTPHPLRTGGQYDPSLDAWTATRADASAPVPAAYPAAVWTGSRMLVWGGFDSNWGDLLSGASYNPAANTWSAIDTGGAPTGNQESLAFWTGSKMIVWNDSRPYNNQGGIYDPASNSWSPMAGTAPPARAWSVGVWTGSEMILWGGLSPDYWDDAFDGKFFSPSTGWGANLSAVNAPVANNSWSKACWTGNGGMLVVDTRGCARYQPSNDTWTSVPNTIPDGQSRRDHAAVWTGTEMLIWGGTINGAVTDTGKRYNPVSGTWKEMNRAGAPSPRRDFAAVWSGSELIVWGGTDNGVTPLPDGARYNPGNDTWTPMALPPAAPQTPWGTSLRDGRSGAAAVWTPMGMFLWGGSDGYDNQGQELPTLGAFYRPDDDSWTGFAFSSDSELPGRWKPTAAYIHPKIYLAGGRALPPGSPGSSLMTSVIAYDLEQDAWTTLPAAPQTLARDGFSLTAAGNRLALWGGRDAGGAALANGLAFDTTRSTWAPLATDNAPVARSGHTAVWTGRELVVWGGKNDAGAPQADGRRLELDGSQWNMLGNAPPNTIAEGHSAIWTGSEMILYGQSATSRDQCARYRPAVTGHYYVRP